MSNQNRSAPKAIIFDFDGTLADTLTTPGSHFLQAMEKVGVTNKTHDEVRKYFGAGADRILAALIPDAEKAKAAFQHYLDLKRNSPSVLACNWHSEIERLLIEIQKEKIPTAIVTGRHSEDLALVAAHLKLDRFFIQQICDDHLAKSKPDPEGIRLAAERLGVNPEETLYVGDSLGDMEAAKAAGSIAIAALWDSTVDPEKLSALADYTAQTPAEVLKIFHALQTRAVF